LKIYRPSASLRLGGEKIDLFKNCNLWNSRCE